MVFPEVEMTLGFITSLAQFESGLISRRAKASMQRAREKETRVGRPPISEEKQ
jgi:DNA invertase Pin-like site-specific DNA recombinase